MDDAIGNQERKKYPRILPVAAFLFLSIFLAACASTQKKEGTGEFVDDTAITTKVKSAILKDPALKVRQINVQTYKGVVQITGFVENIEDARKASNIAAEVDGVVSVKNDLIVK